MFGGIGVEVGVGCSGLDHVSFLGGVGGGVFFGGLFDGLRLEIAIIMQVLVVGSCRLDYFERVLVVAV